MSINTQVLVYDAYFQEIALVSWKRAVCLVVRGKAEVVEELDKQIHPKMKLPLAIRLIKAIRRLWKDKVPWNRTNVFIRDEYRCGYCNKKLTSKEATIDHVIPVSRGGKNTWDNTITSCFDCNNLKNNRLPSEAGMSFVRKPPYAPTIMEIMQKYVKINRKN